MTSNKLCVVVLLADVAVEPALLVACCCRRSRSAATGTGIVMGCGGFGNCPDGLWLDYIQLIIRDYQCGRDTSDSQVVMLIPE